jgi:hypothetical protein
MLCYMRAQLMLMTDGQRARCAHEQPLQAKARHLTAVICGDHSSAWLKPWPSRQRRQLMSSSSPQNQILMSSSLTALGRSTPDSVMMPEMRSGGV